MRGNGTSAAADGNEPAVPAFVLPRHEAIEARGRRAVQRVLVAVDASDRFVRVTREAGARVQVAVRAERVGVLAVNFERPLVHAVGRGEAALARLVAQERHLLVDEMARVAYARALWRAGAQARHARAVQRLRVAGDEG